MTSRRRAPLVAAVCVLAISAGCAEPELDPPDRAARVAEAERVFDAGLFDTVTWSSEAERARVGNATYAAECRNCHGPLGRGGTSYAAARGLDVPSLVEPEWPLAASLDSVRHRIFVGHVEGMPTWGIAGLPPREIDGAAFYVLEQLRPEIAGR